MNNTMKTFFLLAGLSLLLVIFGRIIGGPAGAGIAFIFACVINLGAYWFSDKLVLAQTRAVPISEQEIPEVYKIVSDLSARAGLPMPKVYLLPTASPNAFATGRDPEHAVVAVSKGLIELCNAEELAGVIAHELSHIQHRDILISSIAATLAGAIGMLASMLRWGLMFGGGRRQDGERSNPFVLIAVAIVMPFAALLIQMAVSRSREYDADKRGAEICGNPLYLASALRKIDQASRRYAMPDVSPTTAHMYINNPLTGNMASLFSTHPDIEDRIARLEKMASGRA